MLYVVTATHNRKQITTRFAEQLKLQKNVQTRFVLVDDGSTDGTADAVKALLPDVVLIQGNGNLWWGGALNEAYKWLTQSAEVGSYVMFSNDDVVWEDGYLSRMVKKLEQNPKTLVSGYGIGNLSHEVVDTPLEWDYKKFDYQRISDVNQVGNCASTRSLIFRIEDLKDIGGFHPVLLPHYASDYEWTMRAARKGYSIITGTDITYTVCEDSTGIRNRKKATLKQVFSKKSNMNPIYRMTFLLLATPVRYWIPAMYYQVKRLK